MSENRSQKLFHLIPIIGVGIIFSSFKKKSASFAWFHVLYAKIYDKGEKHVKEKGHV